MTATTYNIFKICMLCDGYGYIQVNGGEKNKCQCIKDKEEKYKEEFRKVEYIFSYMKENYSKCNH